MKITAISTSEIIMQNPDSIHNYFGWPTVARLQNGKLAAVASGFRREHVCPFGKAVISYSEDDGKSWTIPAPVIDTPLDDRDGGILAYGKSNVIVTSFNNTREFQRSVAARSSRKPCQGDYFRAYLEMVAPEEEEKYLGSTFRISNDFGVTFGPVMKCPVSSPHGPCEMPDGSLLYVGWEYGKESLVPYEREFIQAHKINPDGTSEFLGQIDAIEADGVRLRSEEPHAIALADGTVICHIRVENDIYPRSIFTIYQSVSKDGGRTWTKPEPIIGALDGAPAHIMKHSSGALISVYGFRCEPYEIRAMISLDNGNTWDINHVIYTNNVNGDFGYPSTVELSDGSLLTVFYAHPDAASPAVIMQQRWKLEI